MISDYFTGLFWLLLPVAAASGWYMARRTARSATGQNGPQDLSSNYFKGLNYLLNEQPDKAIEVFIKMLEVESETIETHLALGNLFRRRGEVDRAIRIHQNLIARSSLNKEQRCLAVLELGMDYMRSGLLDRAESLFKELLQEDLYTEQALKQLVEISQQEQDWEKAIAYAHELELKCGEDMRSLTAQFYCEQASQSIRQGGSKQATALLKRALNIDPTCVRASLMEGKMAMEAGQPMLAIRSYKRIEHQDSALLAEAMWPLMKGYKAIGKLGEFSDYVRLVSQKYAGITPILVLAELIADKQGIDQAIRYMSQELRKRPSVRGLDRLIEYSLARENGSSRQHLELLKEFTSRLLEGKSIYKCRRCGFMGKTLHWQCPGCKCWNTVKPIHGIEGE